MDEWGKLGPNPSIGKFKFLLENNSGDFRLTQAITLLSQFDISDILDAHDHAKQHINTTANLTIMTSFMAKGITRDEIELDDDLNDSIEDIINIPPGKHTDADRALLCNYFVACTRHRHNLINAKHLI